MRLTEAVKTANLQAGQLATVQRTFPERKLHSNDGLELYWSTFYLPPSLPSISLAMLGTTSILPLWTWKEGKDAQTWHGKNVSSRFPFFDQKNIQQLAVRREDVLSETGERVCRSQTSKQRSQHGNFSLPIAPEPLSIMGSFAPMCRTWSESFEICFPIMQPFFPLAWRRIGFHKQTLERDGLWREHPLHTTTLPAAKYLHWIYSKLKDQSMKDAIAEKCLRSGIPSSRRYVWGAIHSWVPKIMSLRMVCRFEQLPWSQHWAERVPPASMICLLPWKLTLNATPHVAVDMERASLPFILQGIKETASSQPLCKLSAKPTWIVVVRCYGK